MSRSSTSRAPRRHAGLLLAMVALAVQLATASIVLPLAAPADTVDRLVAASICHPGEAPDHQPPPACTICPLCQAIAQSGMLLAPPAFALAAPAAAGWHPPLPPPAGAPPDRVLVSAYARGPPRLI